MTFSAPSSVRQWRWAQFFMTVTEHGEQSTFRLTTVTRLPRGAHWRMLEGPHKATVRIPSAAAR